MSRLDGRFWTLITVVLLFVAASRLLRLNDVALNPDEIWSVWQSLGTPTQVIQWTPYDWPPLYYLTLGAWRQVAGIYPVSLRLLSALIFPLGAVFLFRVMQRLHNSTAAWFSLLAYSALGFSIQLSLEVRGYALLLVLLPLALWLTLRYFEHPNWKRALLLAIVLSAQFYTSLTSVGAFFILGLFTLVLYRRAVWRWWLPGIIAGILALPEIINKAQIANARVAATQTLQTPPLIQIFRDYAGLAFGLWITVFVAAVVMIGYRERRFQTYTVAFGLWAIGMPILMYITNPLLGFFSPRYAWWIMPGIALIVGAGLAYLPRAGRLAASLILIGILFYPLPQAGQYQIWDQLSPLGTNFMWLRDHMQWGDVIVSNTDHTCGAPEEWDYYLRAYFPNGLQFIAEPAGQRRLWVLNPGEQPPTIQEIMKEQYIPGRFVGPPSCLFRLYEAPPDPIGILYDNGLRFHGADIINPTNTTSGPMVRHEGEAVRLRLWWSVDKVLPLDYSIKTYFERGQTVYDTLDAPPQVIYPLDASNATSHWQPGQYYLEERELKLPYPANGNYIIKMAVYFWEDPIPIPAPGVDDNGQLILNRVTVKSY